MAQFDEGRALLIGVSEYATADLEHVALTTNEARDIAGALKSADVAAYPGGHVTTLLDAEAKREKVVEALQDLAAKTKPADTVFLYLASHGDLSQDGEYYFATYDVQLAPNGTIVKDSGLSAPRLRELLEKIKAKKLLVLINTCFSGEVTGTLSSKRGAPPSTSFNYELLATGQGRAVITASRAAQVSYFLRTGQSYTYFGQAVLDALHGKGINTTSGYIGLFEFYSAVYDNVSSTLKGLGAKQEPTLTLSQAVGPFPIALKQGGKVGSLSADSIQQTAPTEKAVDRVSEDVIKAIHQKIILASGAGAMAAGGNIVRAEGEGAVAIGGSLIDFGTGNQFRGQVTFGDVAGRDIIKNYTTTVGASAGANDQQELIKLIQSLRADLAKTKEFPEDARDDADAALEAAEKAGSNNRKDRLLEKLELAQQVMLKLGATIPAAIHVGETIGTLLQRASVLWS